MHLLSVEDLELSFGGVKALSDVNIHVDKGELVAIIGPNGAGKTSLINCISGFYKPQRGRIYFDGRDITDLPPHERVRLGIVRTFQGIGIYPKLTVLENVMLGLHHKMSYTILEACVMKLRAFREEEKGRSATEDLLNKLGLLKFRDSLAGTLPPGIQKKVALARALAMEPTLLLLDEPMGGLSFEEKVELSNHIVDINESGVTVVLIEHDMNIIYDLAQRVIVMNEGRVIAEGKPDEVFNDPQVIMAYTGREKWYE